MDDASQQLKSVSVWAEESEIMLSTEDNNGQANLCEFIWSLLPNDAIEGVMLRLPMRSLLRARCVCKEWNSVIVSRNFKYQYERVPNQNAWLLIFPYNDASVVLAYDPSIKGWFILSFEFLPFMCKFAATAQGLACLMPIDSCHKEWIVCNPISRTWEGIPSPPGLFKLFFRVIELFVADDAEAFKVVVAGSELVAEDSKQFIVTTEVYDSMIHCWRKGSSILLDAPLSGWKATSAGRMYCLTGSLPYKVLAYDVQHGYWFVVNAPLPENLTAVSLIDHGGKLLLVGGVGLNGITSKIGIWKLNSVALRWNDVGWMPTHICNELLRTCSRRFVCIGNGNFLYFSSRKCRGVLEHNMLHKTWQWIPINSSFVNIHYHMLQGFNFQPRLHF